MTYYNQDYLAHYGVKGMKWGIRRSLQKISSKISTANKKRKQEAAERQAERKKLAEQRAKERGPKRYGILNAANSAARSFYRTERTRSFRKYQNQRKQLSVKEARLTKKQIDAGRYRVAKFRNITAKTASFAAGVGAAALLSNPVGILAMPIANLALGGTYYSRQQRAYGGTRDKYQSQKRVRSQ